MAKMTKLGIVISVVALLGFLAPQWSTAATVTKYIEFDGAVELWNWTTTGQTKLGGAVNSSTLPNEMDDPAKLSWYGPTGTLLSELRNYRPNPDGYIDLNDWKGGTAMGLVAFNLAGSASGSSILQDWGEQSGLSITVGSRPTAAPGYDNVGTNWFAQTASGSGYEPQWWCEAQADAIDKALTGQFTDAAELTFDDSSLNPDGTLSLWIGGYVTEDLAGVESGTAAYGVLEGLMRAPAYTDDDGDGHYADKYYNAGAIVDDCDDDASDDPAECATCTCDQAVCAPCARCIYYLNPYEWSGDAVDSNCNGQLDCFIATAAFGTFMEGKIDALRTFRDNVLMNHHWGRVFVDYYYYLSPSVASYIDDHASVKAAVRTLLLPVVGATWMINSQKGIALAAMMALGFCAFGLLLGRKEKMKSLLVVMLVVGFAAVPVMASAGADSVGTTKAAFDAALQEGKTCSDAVAVLIKAGNPEAEVVKVALESADRCDETEIITSAIQAGADPFTVAYVAKNGGVDLEKVVKVTEEVSAPDFPPSAPAATASVPVIVTGTGSSWGSSHYVASPSL